MTFDIYTNRVPFGLLTEDEQRQFIEYEGEILAFYGTRFAPRRRAPRWYPERVYRAVKHVPTKSSINWDHVADEFIVMTTDEDKSTWLYEKIPNAGCLHWAAGSDAISAQGFASFVPGTCDWRDSLVMRPGFAGGDDT